MNVDITVPNGKSGEWKVDEINVRPPSLLENARASLREYGRIAPEGTYKRLRRGKTTIMSNTPDEIRDTEYFVQQATGKVLLNGLGLGVTVKMLLEKDDITEIRVIEKSEDVIALSAATYETDPRVKIIHADALEYMPEKGERFNAVWHDIWDSIHIDNLEGMIKLHRKYGRKTDYQESWCREICERERRLEQAQENNWY